MKHACKRCGHEWASRVQTPVACPKCKSYQWQMHALLTGHHQTDHIDGDGLHNWRSNLRAANNAQNQWNQNPRRDNTSGYSGVTRQANGKWVARIRVNGRRIHLGTFTTAELAAEARNDAAKQHHGEFARIPTNRAYSQ